MIWYLLLRSDKTTDDVPYYISTKSDLDGFRWWNFAECKSIEAWRNRAWIQSAATLQDSPPDDGLANDDGLLIFSKRMQQALDAGGVGGIQYLPIRILKSDGTEYQDYSIANILNCPTALDRKRSQFSVFTADDSEPEDVGRISSLLKAALNQKALDGFHIIRLVDFLEAVYVSQHFVDFYTTKHLTGYLFSRVEVAD
jgi:hypothetical protein